MTTHIRECIFTEVQRRQAVGMSLNVDITNVSAMSSLRESFGRKIACLYRDLAREEQAVDRHTCSMFRATQYVYFTTTVDYRRGRRFSEGCKICVAFVCLGYFKMFQGLRELCTNQPTRSSRIFSWKLAWNGYFTHRETHWQHLQ